jgi:hypothetical protein
LLLLFVAVDDDDDDDDVEHVCCCYHFLQSYVPKYTVRSAAAEIQHLYTTVTKYPNFSHFSMFCSPDISSQRVTAQWVTFLATYLGGSRIKSPPGDRVFWRINGFPQSLRWMP